MGSGGNEGTTTFLERKVVPKNLLKRVFLFNLTLPYHQRLKPTFLLEDGLKPIFLKAFGIPKDF